MLRRLLPALVLVMAAVIVVRPRLVGLSSVISFAQLAAFPGVLAVGGLVFLLAGAIVLGMVRPRGTIAAWVAGAAVAGLVASCLAGGAVLGRGLTAQSTMADVRASDVRIVSFNTFGKVSDADLEQLIRRADAQIVVLPETSLEQAQRIGTALGGDYQAFTSGPVTSADSDYHTAALVRADVGEFAADARGTVGYGARSLRGRGGVGSVRATTDGGIDRITAIHTAAPTPGAMAAWRSDVPHAVSACTARGIVAGDFNASFDHAVLASHLAERSNCADAATELGMGGWGTWPSRVPSLLAAPIDHVLYDRDAFEAVAYRTVTVGASDHRALLVGLDVT